MCMRVHSFTMSAGVRLAAPACLRGVRRGRLGVATQVCRPRTMSGERDVYMPQYPVGTASSSLSASDSLSLSVSRGVGLRGLSVECGVNPGARGSAYVELGGTKVVVSVFGPRPLPRHACVEEGKGWLQCDVRHAAFAVAGERNGRPGGPPTEDDRDMSRQLLQALAPSVLLDAHPDTQVEVYGQILEDEGGGLCGAIVASSLALANAGVELKDVVASCRVCALSDAQLASLPPGGVGQQRPRGSRLLLDPTEAESRGSQGTATLALMPAAGEVTLTTLSSKGWSVEDTAAALQLGLQGCKLVEGVVRGALKGDGSSRDDKLGRGSSPGISFPVHAPVGCPKVSSSVTTS